MVDKKEQIIRVMKAPVDPIVPEDLDPAAGPWWVSPKLDGIRSRADDGQMLSTSNKLHPNLYMRSVMSHPLLHGLDGELTVGPSNAPDCINTTTSGINTISGEPDFAYNVFDRWDIPDIGFRTRLGHIKRRVLACRRAGLPVVLVPQILCHTVAEVRAAVDANYDAGYEGSMIRSYDDGYKYNRATAKEGYIFKVKEFVDFEVQITELIEMMHNDNEATIDERGLTKRSSHKANKRPAGTLGKMKGVRTDTGEIVTVGTGKMKAEEKLRVWQNPKEYLGAFAKCRSGKHGVKDKPRFPRWIVWRDETDM